MKHLKYLSMIALTLAMFTSCAHKQCGSSKSCDLKNKSACSKGECSKDKSCCQDKCNHCTGEKEACKTKDCDSKHHEEKKAS